MAQQCLPLAVHNIAGTAAYDTHSASYNWHSSVWHQQCTALWCDNLCSCVQLLVAAGRTVIIVHAVGEGRFVPNSLFIFKYS